MSNVRGLRDMQEDEEEEKRQAYYAGGQGQNGGGSGQQVLDPNEFMRHARDELGARSIEEYEAERQQAGGGGGDGGAFEGLGAGRSLADSGPPPEAGAGEGAQASPPPRPQAQVHTITFYRDGFTVDEGPLRATTDPENARFLLALRAGEVPRELESPQGGASLASCARHSPEREPR